MRAIEEWRPVPGFDGLYEASDLGRVRSCGRLRTGRGGRWYAPRVLRGNLSNGYLQLNLCHLGVRCRRSIHRIVAEVFLPNPDALPQVNHKDGNKTNNAVSNLEWVSSSDNHLHAYRTGLQRPLNRRNHGNAKLSYEEAAWVLAWVLAGFKQKDVAAVFGVSAPNVSIMCSKNNFDHLVREAYHA